MSHAVLPLLICMLAAAQDGPSRTGEIPPQIERFLERCELSRQGAILDLEHQLRGLRNQPVPGRESKQRIAARMAGIEEQLRVLRAGAQPVVPQIGFPPNVGDIGRLPRLACHVDQVLSADELLVRCQFPVVVTTVKRFRAQRETVVQSVQLLIRGLPTAKVKEGSDLEMLQVFEIVGKERYQRVAGGSRDVLVLKKFDLERVEPYFRRMADERR